MTPLETIVTGGCCRVILSFRKHQFAPGSMLTGTIRYESLGPGSNNPGLLSLQLQIVSRDGGELGEEVIQLTLMRPGTTPFEVWLAGMLDDGETYALSVRSREDPLLVGLIPLSLQRLVQRFVPTPKVAPKREAPDTGQSLEGLDLTASGEFLEGIKGLRLSTLPERAWEARNFAPPRRSRVDDHEEEVSRPELRVSFVFHRPLGLGLRFPNPRPLVEKLFRAESRFDSYYRQHAVDIGKLLDGFVSRHEDIELTDEGGSFRMLAWTSQDELEESVAAMRSVLEPLADLPHRLPPPNGCEEIAKRFGQYAKLLKAQFWRGNLRVTGIPYRDYQIELLPVLEREAMPRTALLKIVSAAGPSTSVSVPFSGQPTEYEKMFRHLANQLEGEGRYR